MDTLYLHIGDGKTGTSYLQSLLALHRGSLNENGILYPVAGRDHLQAELGRVTGGNRAVVDEENWTRHFAGGGAENILISAEHLIYGAISDFEGTMNKWADWRRELGAKRLAILLFIRNPVDHAASLFQQGYKTGLIRQESLSDYFLNYDRTFRLAKMLGQLDSRNDFDVSVFNYSRRKNELREIICAWLGIAPSTLDREPASIVNRGLTYAELRLVGAVARRDSSKGLHLANAFSNALPDLKPFRAVPPPEVQERMLASLEPAMQEIETLVGAENALEPVVRELDPNREPRLGFRQWMVVLKYVRKRHASRRGILDAMRSQHDFDFN